MIQIIRPKDVLFEYNTSNTCSAKNGEMWYLKDGAYSGFAFVTTEGREDTESTHVAYINLPLSTTPQANFSIDFNLYIKDKSPNVIFECNNIKYKWNHDGSDIIQI